MTQEFIVGYERPDGSRYYAFINITIPKGSVTDPLEAAKHTANSTARLSGHRVVTVKRRVKEVVTAL
ncbi:hypothetical protein [Synechococcus elongatus]|uniref:hypothetical protein n=1 Tax=Synechococcus elongatus TaxID=32046 RepID=UPI000F7F0A39|nr:hypothetical protein [Synechococcus elongatus]